MKLKSIYKLTLLTLLLCAAFTLCFAVSAFATDASGDAALPADSSEDSADVSSLTAELFTERDLEQEPDTADAETITLSSGKDVTIPEAGVYILRGTAKETTVTVEADKDAKVQLVLDGVSITNTDFPCIYVKSADKVFVTTVSDSALTVSGGFRRDGDINTDAAVFSRADLTLNGCGALTISSTDNGVVSKDDLKITGGSYVVSAKSKAFEANDSIRVAAGSFTINAGSDGLHAENDEDETLGNLYLLGGRFSITAGDDALHANTLLQIEGGNYSITAAEGLEATKVLVNGGILDVKASDDGVNAARKSSALSPAVEINGGRLTVTMGAGDTDAVDSNGDLTITGGRVEVTGNSGFDVDGSISFTGGTVIVNGQEVSTIPNQMMGGGGFGGKGGFGGGKGGFGGQLPADGQMPADGEFPADGQFPGGGQRPGKGRRGQNGQMPTDMQTPSGATV
ncbi:MAG: carbohydrate-binding domain-containing protein [Oscillospiraceae bacterium]|nr:carbohydrate-binding domain-containing protein [Oscillospiraceae bacterium]